MANPLPNALALTAINDGANIIAADHRNNYAAIAAAVNALRAALAGGSAGQIMQAADGTDVQWATGAILAAVYRKTTAKQVVNSLVETDLLNGEVTVAAGAMGTNRALRLTAFGDLINNTGGTVATPRLKLKLGATTLIDSNVLAATWLTDTNRRPWRLDVLIQNLGAANSQWTDLVFRSLIANAAGAASLSTGEGLVVTTGAADAWEAKGGNSSAVDTTAAQLLALTVTLPTANALEDMTLKGALVEII